jgi:hypothetical protein
MNYNLQSESSSRYVKKMNEGIYFKLYYLTNQGGYRLELLDSKENKIMDLTKTDSDEGFMYGNAT